jgi:hypothetical protein
MRSPYGRLSDRQLLLATMAKQAAALKAYS